MSTCGFRSCSRSSRRRRPAAGDRRQAQSVVDSAAQPLGLRPRRDPARPPRSRSASSATRRTGRLADPAALEPQLRRRCRTRSTRAAPSTPSPASRPARRRCACRATTARSRWAASLSRDQIIQMAGGITTLPPGRVEPRHGSLGRPPDLASATTRSSRPQDDRNCVDPHAPAAVDPAGPRTGELQCTTCHDPHDNALGDFLVMNNTNSALCTLVPPDLDDDRRRARRTAARCHQPHSAPSGPYLLSRTTVTTTCLGCHDGSRAGAANIAADLEQDERPRHRQPRRSARPRPPARRRAPTATSRTRCRRARRPRRSMPAELRPDRRRRDRRRTRCSTSATYEYEVCFRCHADENVVAASLDARGRSRR